MKAKDVYKIMVLAIAVSILSSCVQGKKSKISTDIAQHGFVIAQLSEQYLLDVNILYNNQDYKKEYLNIVNHLSPEQYKMTYTIDDAEELHNIYKINAFNSLKAVFAAYKLQFDAKISEKASGVRSKIYASCAALDSLSINEDIKNKADKLKKNAGNAKYRLGQAIYSLTDIYSDLWKEESMLIFKKMAILKKESSEGIKNIPVKAFDSEKLKKVLQEPYDNDYVLANLYKLKMLEENNARFTRLENQMQKITAAFDLLTQLEAETLKRKQEPFTKRELDNKLDILLNGTLELN